MHNEIICNFCKGSFKTINNLKTHQKRAKYCIKIQEKENINIPNDMKNCEYCMKSYTPSVLKIHLQNCKLRKEEIIKEDKEKIIILEKKLLEKDIEISELKTKLKIYENDHEILKELAKQPKNIINNNTNNTNNKILSIKGSLDLNDTNKIKEIINDNYKIDYIFDGQKGFAQFALDHILKDEDGKLKYICTDPSRQIFKYKDNFGDIQKDIEAKKLTNFLVEGGIKNKASDITTSWLKDDDGFINKNKYEIIADKVESIITLKEDNTVFKKELAAMTTI